MGHETGHVSSQIIVAGLQYGKRINFVKNLIVFHEIRFATKLGR
jgi:hypothetical protein